MNMLNANRIRAKLALAKFHNLKFKNAASTEEHPKLLKAFASLCDCKDYLELRQASNEFARKGEEERMRLQDIFTALAGPNGYAFYRAMLAKRGKSMAEGI